MTVRALVEKLDRRLPGSIPDAGPERFRPRTDGELAIAMELGRTYGMRLAPTGAEEGSDALTVDLGAMGDMLGFDATSELAHVQAGISVVVLDRELSRRGLSLGIAPPIPETTVGAWLSAGAPGAPQRENDPVSQLVAGLDAVLLTGRQITIRPAPRRAVGPDIIPAIVSGRLGIATALHISARRRTPEGRLALLFPAEDDARTALAWMRGRGVRPARAELERRAEGMCLSLTLAGPGPVQDAHRHVALAVAKEHRGLEA